MLASANPRPSADPGPEDAGAVLMRHGRSFHWAGRFLARGTLRDAATLYAFCRYVDDAVDAATSANQACAEIDSIRASLEFGAQDAEMMNGFLDLAVRHQIDWQLPLALVDGVSSDLGTVRMKTRRDLLRYCYRVAGTVGAMMCPVLGASDPRALPFSVDLGIAMQLTNIARDVLADARADRLYLPAEDLRAKVTCEGLVRGEQTERAAALCVVVDLLELAETYYSSADRGLRFIPARSRLAILVAGRLYRAIGLKIMRRPSRVWQGRTAVPRMEKAMRSAAAVVELAVRPSLSGLSPVSKHEHKLHAPLAGLVPS